MRSETDCDDILMNCLLHSLICDIFYIPYLSDWRPHVSRLIDRRIAMGTRSYAQGRRAMLLWLIVWSDRLRGLRRVVQAGALPFTCLTMTWNEQQETEEAYSDISDWLKFCNWNASRNA